MVKSPGLGWTSEKTAGVGWAMQTSWLFWEGGWAMQTSWLLWEDGWAMQTS